MRTGKEFSFRSRIKSFGYAFAGLTQLLKQEPNVRIHLVATVAVIIAGIIQKLSNAEWVVIAIAVGLVWIAEAFNTALEMLCDLITDHTFHPVVKKIKDISAAAVLVASITSIIIALFVFL